MRRHSLVVSGIDARILARLEEQAKEEGPLPRSLELYYRLLQVQAEAKSRQNVPKLGLGEADIAGRIKSGVPLLAFADLHINWPQLAEVFQKVVNIVRSYSEVFGEIPESLDTLRLRERLIPSSGEFERGIRPSQKFNSPSPRQGEGDRVAKEPGLELLQEMAKIWYKGDSLPSCDGVQGTLMEFIMQSALKPLLARHREAVLGLIIQDQWRCGYCPVCGGNPDFAYLDKEGARWLLCSRCDTEWLFQRLECPYCGNQHSSTLAYFTDDDGLYRLYVCDQCQHYLKAIDLRRANYEVLLPLERLLTMDIDVQARHENYSPCPQGTRGQRVST
ncbi:MAG: formate dehydrogenase accessory protein FdhE [Chloroflexi bacterium]|nr:formate dehydrogenase accessory protein FdhE [Chloroflexota bacterium]